MYRDNASTTPLTRGTVNIEEESSQREEQATMRPALLKFAERLGKLAGRHLSEEGGRTTR
jgi:hypothetical protein